MYFPYLRGRQYELLAIGELIDNNLSGAAKIYVSNENSPLTLHISGH